MEREQCKYYIVKDITPWHGDVFDHPDYKYFCSYGGNLKELIFPAGQCNRCIKNTTKFEIILNNSTS